MALVWMLFCVSYVKHALFSSKIHQALANCCKRTIIMMNYVYKINAIHHTTSNVFLASFILPLLELLVRISWICPHTNLKTSISLTKGRSCGSYHFLPECDAYKYNVFPDSDIGVSDIRVLKHVQCIFDSQLLRGDRVERPAE